jgi:hypothetical protein
MARFMVLPMQSVIILTSVVSSNPGSAEVYSIQYYVIKFVSDLRQISVTTPSTGNPISNRYLNGLSSRFSSGSHKTVDKETTYILSSSVHISKHIPINKMYNREKLNNIDISTSALLVSICIFVS